MLDNQTPQNQPNPAPSPRSPSQTTQRQTTAEPERVGGILRRTRVEQHKSIESVADYLRIRPNYIMALEENRYDELPADAYIVGFLRSYAAHLELDVKAMVDKYRYEMSGRRNKPRLSMPQPISEGRTPTAMIMTLAAVGTILIYALWYGLSSSSREVATAPVPLPTLSIDKADSSPIETAMPPSAVSTPAAKQTANMNATPTTPEQAASVKSQNPPIQPPLPVGQIYGDVAANTRLVIRAHKESWVLISDSQGVTLFDHILKPGDVFKVPDMKGLALTSGNGGGIVLVLDGVSLPPLAEEQRVIRNVPLDFDKLKSTPAGAVE